MYRAVPKLPLIKTLSVLFAALFLFAQAMAQAHIIEFGPNHSHHHDFVEFSPNHHHDNNEKSDGATCFVMILGEDGAVIPNPPETDTPQVLEVPVIAIQPTRMVTFDGTLLSRAPPPRAPPVWA